MVWVKTRLGTANAKVGQGSNAVRRDASGAVPDTSPEISPNTSGGTGVARGGEQPLVAAHFDGAQTGLGTALDTASSAARDRQDNLAFEKRQLANAISRDVATRAQLLGQEGRIFIALVWLVTAGLLAIKSGQGPGVGLNAPGSFLAWLPASDAAPLAQVFLMVGAAGLFVGAALWLYFKGQPDDRRPVKRRADRLGADIAAQARALDTDVAQLTQKIQHGQGLSNDLQALTTAQHKVFEVQMFFKELSFLVPENHRQSMADLKQYLSGRAEPATLFVFAGGVALGLLMGWLGFAERGVQTGPTPDIMRYPVFFMLLVGGVSIYALAGLLSAVLSGFNLRDQDRAVEAALDGLRSAYLANNGPRLDDIIRRVEDAMTVTRSRAAALEKTAAKPQKSSSTNADHHASGPATKQRKAAPTETWQPTHEKPVFVETDFAASPKAFLRDGDSPAGRPKATPKTSRRRLFW